MKYAIDTPEMQFAIAFVLEAGKLIRETFSTDFETEWKADDSPITKVDIAINDRFIAEVSKRFPTYGILGEEASKPQDGPEWTWVIDPIDGTAPFVQGMPVSTCCVSLLRNGIPELGVIYDPHCDRLFYAQKGKGAYLNDQKIGISTTTTLNKQYVHVDSLKTGDRRLLPLRGQLLDKGATPMIIGSIQYGVALTCAGRTAGVVFTLPSFWDAAAAYCIGTEAGAVITDLHGNEQRYDQPIKGFILANPTLHAELLAMVRPLLADAKVGE